MVTMMSLDLKEGPALTSRTQPPSPVDGDERFSSVDDVFAWAADRLLGGDSCHHVSDLEVSKVFTPHQGLSAERNKVIQSRQPVGRPQA